MGEGGTEGEKSLNLREQHLLISTRQEVPMETGYKTQGRENSFHTPQCESIKSGTHQENGTLRGIIELVDIPVCSNNARIPLAALLVGTTGEAILDKGKPPENGKGECG